MTSDVEILVGKHKGKIGYVVSESKYRVSVRYQSGIGWQTSQFLPKSIRRVV